MSISCHRVDQKVTYFIAKLFRLCIIGYNNIKLVILCPWFFCNSMKWSLVFHRWSCFQVFSKYCFERYWCFSCIIRFDMNQNKRKPRINSIYCGLYFLLAFFIFPIKKYELNTIKYFYDSTNTNPIIDMGLDGQKMWFIKQHLEIH